MTDTSLYETDIVAWADRQVEELRRLAEADLLDEDFTYEIAVRRLYDGLIVSAESTDP